MVTRRRALRLHGRRPVQLHDRSHRPEPLLSARQSKRPRPRRRRGAARPDPQPRSPGSFTRNLSAMSLDDARAARNPGPGLPDIRGSALTEAARTLSNISRRRRRAGVGAGALRALAPPAGAPGRRPPPEARGRRGATVGARAGPAPAPWPPATSRATARPTALRRERALTSTVRRPRYESVRLRRLPYCHDTCADPDCPRCAVWRLRPRKMCRGCAVFSPCEVRRHASAESCWLVAGRDVFDVTSFLPRHPAGTRSIVRKAGGADCTEDLGFHSAKAQNLWMLHKIGRRPAVRSISARRWPRRRLVRTGDSA